MFRNLQFSRMVRIALALGVGLLLILLLWSILFLTQSAFDVWDRLQQGPVWLFYAYGLGFLMVAVLSGAIIIRLLWPRKKTRAPKTQPQPTPIPPDRDSLEQRMAEAEQSGIDTETVRRELAKLTERKEAGRITVSFFGEISSGKSSLVKALIPAAEPAVSARGGTTREIAEYHWRSPAGDELILTDIPGTNEVGAGLDQMAREEALRSHIVVYVCDGDLTRSQHDELAALLELGKPSVLALNKTDQYQPDELILLKRRLTERLKDYPRAELASVQAGGQREALKVLPDGSEETVMRPIPPQVFELQQVLQKFVDEDPAVLEQLRESAVFVLVSNQLENAAQAHRRAQAQQLVTKYSRRAVIGAMAAVTPGTDILIQGYLGISLIKEMAQLYDIPVRQVDTDLLLDLVQKHIGRTTTLFLAVAGNALKAFPGIGTLAGGLAHAVAYGLIFDSLGRAVAHSLDTRGVLRPVQAAQAFKEHLSEDLQASARRMAKFALAARKSPDQD